MKVLCFTGEQGSGKGAAINYIVSQAGTLYHFSKILSDILLRLHKNVTRENQIQLGMALRQPFGADVLADVLRQDIIDDQPQIAVVDGLRFHAEWEVLSKLPNALLIAVVAPPKIRFERIKQRREKEDDESITKEVFEEIAHRPTELEIPELIEKADFVIDNSGTLESLYATLNEKILV